MTKLKVFNKISKKIKESGFLRYVAVLTNCRFYSLYTKKKLPARCASFPVHLQVEVSQVCNLKCKMCEYSFKKTARRFMSVDLFAKIINNFTSVYSIDLTGIGEPFCNPDFLEIIYMARSKGISVSFASNGLLLDGVSIDKLLKSGIDAVSFSVDAASKQLYEKIRCGGSFETMINNISHFAQKAKHSNGAGPRISLNYTVSRENISDVPKLPSLAASLSIKEVFYRDLITFPGSNYAASDKLSSFDQDFRIKLREAVIKEADTYSIKVNFCESLFSAEGKRNKFCYRPWVSAFIDVNGNFYPCCHITQKNTDIARYSTGNIATCTPDALWNAAMLTNLRSELARGKDTPALCAGCDCLIKIKEQA